MATALDSMRERRDRFEADKQRQYEKLIEIGQGPGGRASAEYAAAFKDYKESYDRYQAAAKTYNTLKEIKESGTHGSQVSDEQARVGDILLLVMLLNAERVENLERGMRDHTDRIREGNEQVAIWNEAIKRINDDLVALEEGKANNPNYEADYKRLEAEAQNLQAQIRDVTNDSKIEFTYLQDMINKSNNAIEFITNWMSKWYQPIRTTIGNIGH